MTTLEEQLARALHRAEFCEQWYAVRLERIKDLAKSRGIWPEVAAIIANGTVSASEPPTYAQQLNSAIHRAERAEKALAKLQSAHR